MNIEVTQLFRESCKVIRRNYKSELPLDNDLHVVSIHQLSTECLYTDIALPYDISGTKKIPVCLGMKSAQECMFRTIESWFPRMVKRARRAGKDKHTLAPFFLLQL